MNIIQLKFVARDRDGVLMAFPCVLNASHYFHYYDGVFKCIHNFIFFADVPKSYNNILPWCGKLTEKKYWYRHDFFFVPCMPHNDELEPNLRGE